MEIVFTDCILDSTKSFLLLAQACLPALIMTLLKYMLTFIRVIVTPAVYPRLFELHRFDIQSTGQKSHCVNTIFWPSQCYVLIRQSDSPCPYQF